MLLIKKLLLIWILCTTLIMLPSAVMANEVEQNTASASSSVAADSELEPEVNIVENAEETIYEYRINGQLIAVKVQPKQGPVYYFHDSDGDGSFEFSRDNPLPGVIVNQWVLFRW